jgi:IPT/TIG domain-containing protein
LASKSLTIQLSAFAFALVACNRENVTAPVEASFMVQVAGGNSQRAAAGSELAQPLAVQVRDATGAPAKGTRMIFRVVRGAATGSRMVDSVGVTGADGLATGQLLLGSALDTTVVTVFPAAAPERSASFTAFAIAAPFVAGLTPSVFGPGDTVTLRGTGFGIAVTGGNVEFGDAPAAALPGASETSLRAVVPSCLSPGAMTVRLAAGTVRSNSLPATYQPRSSPVTLALYQALTVRSAQLADCLTLAGNGATYLVAGQLASVGSAQTPIDWRLGASVSAGAEATAPSTLRVRDEFGAQRGFEAFLRSTERSIAPQARREAAAASNSPAYLQPAATPPALGSFRDFRVVAVLAGTSFTNVTTRLKYAGDHVLIYVDTVGAGFTDQQYQSLGTWFDRDLYPIDVAQFGSESDVDRDGRVLVVFTPQVNRLARAQDCGQFGYVTGFFYGTDLLLDNPNSNKAEIFYSFIPDSTARFSCAHTTADVLRILPGTFMHELQHMISFNQHVLARGGDPEDIWLNEGLSHIAEEEASKFYEAKFPPPTGRSTTVQLFPDSAGPFIAPQLLNAYVYLNNTLAHSVTSYSGAGSVEDRGASWLFLRWLAEQKGEGVFQRLVQTSKVGVANVEAQAGEPFATLFGDFSVSLFTDSLAGLPRSVVPPRYRFGSRQLRKLMAREAVVSGWVEPWPLPLYLLPVGESLRSNMKPGTMVHALVQTAAGSAGVALRFTHQDLSAFSGATSAQVTIFRLPP